MATAKKPRLTQDQFDAIARAIADPRRFAILQQVASNACTPCSRLTEHECISPATISHHIKELSEAGLVDVVREGRTMQLSLRRDTWQAYLDQLATL